MNNVEHYKEASKEVTSLDIPYLQNCNLLKMGCWVGGGGHMGT